MDGWMNEQQIQPHLQHWCEQIYTQTQTHFQVAPMTQTAIQTITGQTVVNICHKGAELHTWKVTWHHVCLKHWQLCVIRDRFTSTCLSTSTHINTFLNNYGLQEWRFHSRQLEHCLILDTLPPLFPSVSLFHKRTHTDTLYIHIWTGLLRMWWQTARGLLLGQVSAGGSEENKWVCRITKKRESFE